MSGFIFWRGYVGLILRIDGERISFAESAEENNSVEAKKNSIFDANPRARKSMN
jgi:hypothetical protein